MNEDGNSGASYCVYRGTQEILHGRIPLGKKAQIYDADVIEAVAGLRAACSHSMARFAKNVAICLDNEEAAIRLHAGRPSPSSSTQILDFQELRGIWKNRERATANLPGSVEVRWVPAHQKSTGNERAEALAKEACNLSIEISVATIARAKSLSEERYQDE
ncbi:hypothetical protein K3495_g5379 [Podosphaera aphanis]|nr:hypothetical protein K3495_g5379 [Podosphaera aphanis]